MEKGGSSLRGVMRFRIVITLLCVLCLGTATVFGVIHNHHDDADCHGSSGEQQCLACVLHLTGNTTVPVPARAPVLALTYHAVVEPALVMPEFVLLPLAASRAPPETSV